MMYENLNQTCRRQHKNHTLKNLFKKIFEEAAITIQILTNINHKEVNIKEFVEFLMKNCYLLDYNELLQFNNFRLVFDSIEDNKLSFDDNLINFIEKINAETDFVIESLGLNHKNNKMMFVVVEGSL